MSMLRCRASFAGEYAAQAPLALALERILECKLLAAERMERPVLDLGCGDGLFASVLFAQPVDTGIDPDEEELAGARKSGAYEELICCGGAEIPKPDSSYRTVFSNSVLEHIPEIEPVFREVFRILAPGGVFYFTVPADNFEMWTTVNLALSGLGLRQTAARYRTFFNRFWRHYHAYSESQWQAVVTKIGFQVAAVSRYDAPRIALTNDALMALALPSMLLKKLAKRRVLSPIGRRILLWPFRPLFDLWLGAVRHPVGCLVFVKAVKPSSLAS